MSDEKSTKTDVKPETEKPDLDSLYKPVGIQAITAAAICKGTGIKKTKPAS